MDPKIEEELLNVLNAEFNTSLKIDHDNLSATNVNLTSDSTYIHFTKCI